MILRTSHTGGLMRSFKHFTLEERELLHQMVLKGKKQAEMAVELNKSQSSISRELHRLSKSSSEYYPYKSHSHYVSSRSRCVKHKRLENKNVIKDVVMKLKKKWSPEIIANTQPDASLRVSASTVYRALKTNEIPGLTEANALRRRGKRKYCRGGGKTIQAGRSIHLRSDAVNQRTRIGDWEGDTVLGAVGKGVVVTMVDRRSRFLCMTKSPTKKAQDVRKAIVRVLKQHPCLTITFDNGSEFAEYELIETQTNSIVYFADTHSPWQRGSNENINELIRWYFPKGTDFTEVSEDYVQQVCKEINQRPRKVLNWSTPEVVFFKNMHLN